MRALLASAVALLLLSGCADGGGADADGPGDGGDDGTNGDGGAGGGGASATGGTSGSGATGGVATTEEVSLAVAAVGAYPANPAFDPATLSVPAGALVRVTFSNEDLVPVIQHNLVVEGVPDASSATIAPGEQSAFDFVAPAAAGSFTFYCSIGDHRDRGMEGTLTVTA